MGSGAAQFHARDARDRHLLSATEPTAARLRGLLLRTLVQRRLVEGPATVLVACSGGPDSQVLLHALHALAPECSLVLHAASVDHGLRPDAQRDVDKARRLAAHLGVPFACLMVQVSAGASRQAHARDARYHALHAHAAQVGASYVAVGHTLDDQAETVLERLLRGTSIDGLSGVLPRREDGVIRPLLDVRRSLVRAYAAEKSLDFAEDPSNGDPRFLRSRVRHTLLPALAVENPRIPEHFAALAEDARELRIVLGELAERALSRAQGNFRTLSEESPVVRRSALKRHVESAIGNALHRTHLVALERMLTAGGQVRLPGDFVASLGEHGQLVLSQVAKRGRGSQRPNSE